MQNRTMNLLSTQDNTTLMECRQATVLWSHIVQTVQYCAAAVYKNLYSLQDFLNSLGCKRVCSPHLRSQIEVMCNLITEFPSFFTCRTLFVSEDSDEISPTKKKHRCEMYFTDSWFTISGKHFILMLKHNPETRNSM
jgi:hypothetical protein